MLPLGAPMFQTSPNVLNQLLKTANDVDLQLGGEQRTISVVFIDMRGYTTIAEMLPPAQVMNIIKTYIGLIADTLLRYGATLTHYGGDQIMAIFNAPLDQPDHAERAVRATIIAIQEISRFNHSNAVQLLPVQAVFGAGINTGKAVVGNVGTDQRHFYTAIGDTVNIAARRSRWAIRNRRTTRLVSDQGTSTTAGCLSDYDIDQVASSRLQVAGGQGARLRLELNRR